MSPMKLAPSILNADFAQLGEQVAEAEWAGAVADAAMAAAEAVDQAALQRS